MAEPMQVAVMAADGPVWEGEAVQVIVRTTEGDMGVLPGHEPFMAALVPCAAEVTSVDGSREIIALDEGFISVFNNRVSVLSAFGVLAREISLDEARRTEAQLHDLVDSGRADNQEVRAYNRAVAQVKAGEKFAQVAR
jgi:F-type H+-transporting ATPase subunit epsilon